ncbi:MAG: ArnT family glycosyltransferase [Myxococcota bacterium]
MSGVLFCELGSAPVVHRREWRDLEPAQNMLQSGDWVVPRYEGHVRLSKPPLYYWMVAALSWPSGSVTPWTLRIPSAAAAIALAALVAIWGHAIGGGRFAATAAGAFSLMTWIYKQGRRGDAETLYAFFAVLTLFLIDTAVRRSRARAAPWIGVSAGLAFLGKATAALPTLLAPSLVWLATEHRLRDLARAAVWRGVAVAAAIGLFWYALLLWRVPGALDHFYTEIVIPLGLSGPTGGPNHVKPFYSYVYLLGVFALPATLALPLVAWRAWTSRLWRNVPAMRLPGLGLLAVFVVLSLVAEKQRHYIVPMLPLLALVIADAVLAFAREERERLRRWLPAGGVTLAGLCGLGTVFAVAWFSVVLGAAPFLGAVPVGIALVLLAGAALGAGLRRRAAALAGVLVTLNLALSAVAYDSLDVWRWWFLSGHIQERPGFDAQRWDRVFRDHPHAAWALSAGDYLASRNPAGGRAPSDPVLPSAPPRSTGP